MNHKGQHSIRFIQYFAMEPIRIELSLEIMFQSVNCYLIPGDQLTLVDCGYDSPDNWTSFCTALEKHGFALQDIQQVIITHEHRDHVGLLPQIMEHCDAIIRAPKAIEGWFKHPDQMKANYMPFIQQLYETIGFPPKMLEESIAFVKQLRRYPKVKDLNRFVFFEAGDQLEIGHKKWEVWHTPGHCPTQHVFIQPEEKRIFGSDMLLPLTPMPIVSEDPQQPGQAVRALSDLLHSFQKLIPLNLQRVYPGHGPVFDQANQIIQRQIARTQLRKEECLKVYRSGLTSVYQIHQKMYPYHSLPPNYSGIHMILGYLDLLKAEGKLD
ncbi:MAG: MBL fold metallo-hydrolase [Bacteroidota bacterium]